MGVHLEPQTAELTTAELTQRMGVNLEPQTTELTTAELTQRIRSEPGTVDDMELVVSSLLLLIGEGEKLT